MSDSWVQNCQLWLNSTYGEVSGYQVIPVDGVASWGTIYAMRRALQHELGITGLSDNFDTETMNRLAAQMGSITASSPRNVIGLLQCALWCKGYWGGAALGTWDDAVTGAVQLVRADLGLTPGASVPPKVLKSLLSMDSYVRLAGGTAATREAQQWLNGAYIDWLDYPLVPCDGVFSRQVQRSLVFGTQYSVGLQEGVANGNFGPATQAALRTYADLVPGSTDDTRHLVSLFQSALRFNGYAATPLTGVFDAGTVAQTAAFQSFIELGVTGSANYSTWASLLVSTGDVQRPVTACDTSTPVTAATAATLTSGGIAIVGRYINGTAKRLRPDELTVFDAAGLRWFPIYQEYNDSAGHFSYAQGSAQGQRAVSRLRQLGVAPGARVYLAVDFDATDDEITAVVLPHFRGAKGAFDAAGSAGYRLGVYGSRNTCARLLAAGVAESCFVADMSTGYGGNGFPMPEGWAFDQIQGVTMGAGAGEISIDRVVASVQRAESLGRADVARTPLRHPAGGEPIFDESFYWRTAALMYRVDAARTSPLIEQAMLNDLVLNRLQKPTYWMAAGPPDTVGNIFGTMYTPPLEDRLLAPPDVVQALQSTRSDFESAVGSELYPVPDTGLLGDTQHFAASTRGYLTWGVPATGAGLEQGDLGAWALDLVTMWSDFVRQTTGDGDPDPESWIANHLGAPGPEGFSFGRDDLRADMAAFLCARRLQDEPDKPLDQVLRSMLVAIEDDPGWLARTFVNERFGSEAQTIAVSIEVFASPEWSPTTGLAREAFLDGRAPSVAERELVGRGFHRALGAAMTWTER